MSKHILTLYTLPTQDFNVCQKEIVDNQLVLNVTVKKKQAKCPFCDTLSFSHYDTRPNLSSIRYDLWYGHVIWIRVRKRRFICKDDYCDKSVFTEVLPGLSGSYRRSSVLFENHCMRELAVQTFKYVQKLTGASHGFLVRTLSRWIPSARRLTARTINWEGVFKGCDEICIGFDEHGQRKKRAVLTVTNITKRELITILPDDRQRTLEQFLRQIPSKYRKRMRYSATDLTNKYRAVIVRWLPKSQTSADCFHVVALANKLVTRMVRTAQETGRGNGLRKQLWLLRKGKERLKPEEKEKVDQVLAKKGHEHIALAYKTKEDLRDILRTKDSEAAQQALLAFTRRDVWNKEYLTRSELLQYPKSYRTFIATIGSWQAEIITYIRTGITNAYTEGIHTKIKTTKRMSYGIPNLDNYIRKMLLTCNPELHHI